MKEIVYRAVDAANKAEMAYCKFLSANDTGLTGGHQAGIYISKAASGILFDEPGNKGENKEKWVKIRWQEDFFTDSRFIYYGKGSRNEYRITNFGKGFPFLNPENTGDLLILIKYTEEDYGAYVFACEDDLNDFLNSFGMSPSDTNALIQKEGVSPEMSENMAFKEFVSTLHEYFPASYIMAERARYIYNSIGKDAVLSNPDKTIVNWSETEYRLFRYIEKMRYLDQINKGFETVDQFIDKANEVLNRRKSRAGKSLEHHLSAAFDAHDISYSAQPKTEGNKKPDFIFPSIKDYHNAGFNFMGLTYLGAKTTCKDRWRQILNEADRIPEKHLFTLQQGISPQQLDEMKVEKVRLVVPQEYIKCYPVDRRDMIMNFAQFLAYVKTKEKKIE